MTLRFAALVMLSVLLCPVLLPGPSAASEAARTSNRIQPHAKNPRYWQYQGQPVVLLGGSKDDNLFQIPDLEKHLKLLASVGGNYVRNTMSARDAGNVQPFSRTPDGRYDLDRWNEEYWRRFDELLRLTRALNIIVQIEVWDRFDFSREPWETQPFNPKNNINYTYEQSGLAAKYREHPAKNKQPFFFTTPEQQNNAVVLRYQQRFVDELLRRALPYPNVLYCIDNETSGDEAWSAYWANYIHRGAREAGVRAFVTEMWDAWNLQAPQHRRTLDHSERYDFVEVSQNSHQRGESHWRNLQWVRAYIDAAPRPLNAVKTYGADGRENSTSLVGTWDWWRRLMNRPATVDTARNFGATQDGTERWWRQLIGGGAAVRFHRPDSGLGLNAVAQRHIRSARMFLKEFDIVRAAPDADHERLSNRKRNEAYLTKTADEVFAVYFPDGGDVRLRVSGEGEFALKWLDISTSAWSAVAAIKGGDSIRLEAPGSGHWLALLKRKAS